MADVFTVKIVSPRGIESEEKTTSVALPGDAGDMEILPHHVRYAGILGTGVIGYTPQGTNNPVRFVVSGGFITFADDVLTILADSVVSKENRAALGLGEDGLSKERARLEKILQGGGLGDIAWQRAAVELRRLEAVERTL